MAEGNEEEGSRDGDRALWRLGLGGGRPGLGPTGGLATSLSLSNLLAKK